MVQELMAIQLQGMSLRFLKPRLLLVPVNFVLLFTERAPLVARFAAYGATKRSLPQFTKSLQVCYTVPLVLHFFTHNQCNFTHGDLPLDCRLGSLPFFPSGRLVADYFWYYTCTGRVEAVKHSERRGSQLIGKIPFPSLAPIWSVQFCSC